MWKPLEVRGGGLSRCHLRSGSDPRADLYEWHDRPSEGRCGHARRIACECGPTSTTGGPTKKALCYLHAAPLFHIADFPFMFAAPAFGTRQVTIAKFNPQTFCETVQQERVTRHRPWCRR